MYYPQPYYPQYRVPPQYGVRPAVPQQWRPPVYMPPQYASYPPRYVYPQTFNPYQSIIPPVPPVSQTLPAPMMSQILQSPQRQFQSPDRLRQAQSPQRNILMQSQQVPRSPQPQLQSPQKQYLTYEQVQERIRQSQQQQPQQPQKPQQPKYTPPTQQQYKPQPQQQQQQVQPQPSTTKQQPQKQEDDLDKRYQNALKSTEEIIKKYQFDDSGNKERQTNQNEQQEVEDEENLQELALQYEDGYIYRGQGYPPQTRSGFGILTDADGKQVYAGYWKDNLYEGQGRLSNLQTEELNEPIDWNNMTTIGNGWASYEGNFSQGKMHGQGTLILTNQEQYFGEFEDGMIHGDGEFTTSDGQVIKGKWEQGYLTQIQEQE